MILFSFLLYTLEDSKEGGKEEKEDANRSQDSAPTRITQILCSYFINPIIITL